MAGSFTDAAENIILNASYGASGTLLYTGPYKLALVTVIGSDSTAGTEMTGGSYARQTIAFTTSTAGSVANTADVTFTGLPAGTVVGVEIWDSNGTPKRISWMSLGSNKTVAAGDSLTLAAGDLTFTLD